MLDTGIDITHPGIIRNIYTTPAETVDNDADNDGNGYIDDIKAWDMDIRTL